ncbi:hypothetical protein [Aestuariivivens sediminis]|uniref:capsular polysaccharide export protein, LipB/KpsS family n=1 Tax=Aestuariivivens sediminis TaxID=2913557 RepID=UPI001F55C258|nr:hypothetical protein [Aestuariivivens sediminis]
MDLKEISNRFLKWEIENKLYDIKVKDFPIYCLLRVEIYESLMFDSSLKSILLKEDKSQAKRINYLKLGYSVISFFFKQRLLKNSNLYITNTDNKIKYREIYVDNFFDKLIDKDPGKVAVLEFPNIINYHFDNLKNKEKILKAGFLYAAEKIFKDRVDKSQLTKEVDRISKYYKQLYLSINKTELYENIDFLIKKRIIRNLKRIHIYEKLIKYYSPKVVYLKSAYSPLKQILIYVCRKHSTKIIEVQHGHIYPYHIGYLLARDKGDIKNLLPNHIYVWSRYYKNVLLENNWNNDTIKIKGDFTYNHELNEINLKNSHRINELINDYKTIITIISQHTLCKEIDEFLNDMEKLPSDVAILIKLHPRLKLSQEEIFNKKASQFKNIMIVRDGNIKLYFEVSDLIIGVYSTAIIEALEMQKTVHLIDIRVSDFFEDFIQNNIVQKTKSIFESYKMLKYQPEKIKVVFREPFN